MESPEKDPRSITPLMEGVVFSRTPEGFFLGKQLAYADLERQAKYASESGYYVEKGAGELTFKLNSTVAAERGIKSWEITLPEILEKA